MAANTVGKGKPELSATDETERRRYADQAIKVLQEAVEYGLHLNWLPPEFNLLAARPDFQKLVKDVEKRAKRGKP
jgi:hypothetical protein